MPSKKSVSKKSGGKKPLFDKVAIIGIGHIGASLAKAIRKRKLARRLIAGDSNAKHVKIALADKITDAATTDLAKAVKDADLVVLCVPVGGMKAVAKTIARHLKKGAILSDVGSVKQAVIADIGGLVPAGVHFVPAHPIAGTEHSGPKAGLADLFEGRWCILTPLPSKDKAYKAAVAKLRTLWKGLGAKVADMEASRHDRVLGITSHLPHLIAYTVVSTASDLGNELKSEVIRFSASGFRDFTRVASSDPVMWRDIFMNNREAVLEILQRFLEDLTALQRAIRWGEDKKLLELFTRSRAIRRKVLEAKQDSDE
jgi:cyclohexadieny/prephenate dehydrogenase